MPAVRIFVSGDDFLAVAANPSATSNLGRTAQQRYTPMIVPTPLIEVVLAVGRSSGHGKVYSYDGSSWTLLLETSSRLSSIAIDHVSPGGIVVGGDNGQVQYYDGTWHDISLPGGSGLSVTGVICRTGRCSDGSGLVVSTKGPSPTDPGHIFGHGGGGVGSTLEYSTQQYGFNSLSQTQGPSGDLWAVGDHGVAARVCPSDACSWTPVSINSTTGDLVSSYGNDPCDPCESRWVVDTMPQM